MGPCVSTKDKHNKENTNTKRVVHSVNSLKADEKTIMNCKICRDNIKSYIKRLERNEQIKRDKAKQSLIDKDKDRAKMYLNQSKLYREQIKVASGQLNMIEDQILQIESAKMQKEAITVLEQGNKILKQLNEEVNIEKWEKISDDMNEVKQQQDEIANFLKSHNIDENEYEEELNKELDNLMKQQNKEEEINLPDAGKKEIEIKQQDQIIQVISDQQKEDKKEEEIIA
jgi:charged multivesicular body protein 6